MKNFLPNFCNMFRNYHSKQHNRSTKVVDFRKQSNNGFKSHPFEAMSQFGMHQSANFPSENANMPGENKLNDLVFASKKFKKK